MCPDGLVKSDAAGDVLSMSTLPPSGRTSVAVMVSGPDATRPDADRDFRNDRPAGGDFAIRPRRQRHDVRHVFRIRRDAGRGRHER